MRAGEDNEEINEAENEERLKEIMRLGVRPKKFEGGNEGKKLKFEILKLRVCKVMRLKEIMRLKVCKIIRLKKIMMRENK